MYVPMELRPEVERWVQEAKLLKRLVGRSISGPEGVLTSKKKSRKSNKA